ncbi:sensor histidine kinase [Prevotella dentasini]
METRKILCLTSLFVSLLVGLFLTSCSQTDGRRVDMLNERAYAYHYRNLNLAEAWAKRAFQVSKDYDAGRAEAVNNLAFVNIVKMQYARAFSRLDSIDAMTDNQVELLIADIQRMRVCQRKSKNKEFYDYHERAARRMKRIREEERLLSEHQRRRMTYAVSEFHIVTSAYYYYVGLEHQFVKSLETIETDVDLDQDTAQYLNLLYNVGAGGVITGKQQSEVNQQEFDYLVRCYFMAKQGSFTFWEANSLQALSEHLQNPNFRKKLVKDNVQAIKFLNVDDMPDSLLAGNLAQRSLDLVSEFGDVYQTASSYRTLASCYWQIKDYPSAIVCLQNALNRDKAIGQAPDLVASIREQLSVVYAAINDKPSSDFNRNIYLDLQEQTRQDRYLESRAEQLNLSAGQLNIMIAAVVTLIVLLISLLVYLHYKRRKNDHNSSLQPLLEPLVEWQRQNDSYQQSLDERYEEIQEAYHISLLEIQVNKKRNLERRAKIFLVNIITPLIDRMLHEIARLRAGGESQEVRQERYEYISELSDKITDYNDVLTHWIKLQQGELVLRIESFPLQPLFDMVAKSKTGFLLKGIQLNVVPSDARVKADRVLTLFMLNTLADNARKFTSDGGTVTIEANTAAEYVEVSVTDTGRGMSADEAAHIFDHKTIQDDPERKSHGFGLMNCQGIINKYKKLSSLFSVCSIGVRSIEKQGSTFFFRLPKSSVKMLLALILSVMGVLSSDAVSFGSRHSTQRRLPVSHVADPLLDLASIYADSAYFSNINGTYAKTLLFADTCRYYLNAYYQKIRPQGKYLMQRISDNSSQPAEIVWLHDSIPTKYNIILDMRNESAVAALALHQWQLYRYNNKVYTHLFKESSADNTLGEYCRMMQRSESNKNVAVILLVLLLLSILPIYYLVFYRHRVFFRFCLERIQRINDILLSPMPAEQKQRSIQLIASDRFPDKLRSILDQIQMTLQAAIEHNQETRLHLELAEDELKRTKFEMEQLHVSNNILDNCLSTLKHETMYYPSKIRQLVEESDRQLDYIDELASYYKDLYAILSAQATRQVDTIKLECKAFAVSELASNSVRIDCSVPEASLLGDIALIRYLFEILYKQSGQSRLNVSARPKGQYYMVFRVSMPTLGSDRGADLFTPSIANIPYMVCRQIARENGESTNRRACGMEAVCVGQEMYIDVVLAKKG